MLLGKSRRQLLIAPGRKKKEGFPHGSGGKESVAMQQNQVQPLGREDPLENGMATHSSILSRRILWTEEHGGLHPWGHKESDITEQLTHTTKNEEAGPKWKQCQVVDDCGGESKV